MYAAGTGTKLGRKKDQLGLVMEYSCFPANIKRLLWQREREHGKEMTLYCVSTK